MRILLVTQYFWPEGFIINGLAEELKSRGHSVEVLTGLPNYPSGSLSKGYTLFSGPWTEDFRGIPVHRSFILPRGKGFLRLSINYLSFVVGASIKGLFLKKNFDVIFCFAPSPVTTCLPAVFLRWLTKKPLVFWVQDLWPESISAVGAIKSQKIVNTIGKLVRFIYRRCDILLTQSPAFKHSLLKWGGAESKIKYVPNWAEPFPESISPPAWIENLPAGFKIGFAGNIGKAQNMSALVSAAAILKDHKDIKWIVAGDGSEKPWLDREIKRRNLDDVVFTVGKKPYDDMLPFFNKCDALYVSLTNEQIFSLTIPSKVQAYLSAGKPILAYLEGEGARIIEEAGVGYASPCDMPERLAQNVLKLKELSSSQRLEMGENGLKYFNANFEKKLIVSGIEEILKSAQYSGEEP